MVILLTINVLFRGLNSAARKLSKFWMREKIVIWRGEVRENKYAPKFIRIRYTEVNRLYRCQKSENGAVQLGTIFFAASITRNQK